MEMKRPPPNRGFHRCLRRGAVILILAFLPLLATSAAPLNGTVTQERHVVGGGGGYGQSGALAAHGTIGQPLAGTSSTGTYDLGTGFWADPGKLHQVYLPLVLRGF